MYSAKMTSRILQEAHAKSGTINKIREFTQHTFLINYRVGIFLMKDSKTLFERIDAEKKSQDEITTFGKSLLKRLKEKKQTSLFIRKR